MSQQIGATSTSIITNNEAYSELSPEDILNPDGPKGMSRGARSTWLTSFLGEHLPAKRLRSKENDMGSKYESVDCSQKKRRKKGKSKAGVGNLPVAKERISKMLFKTNSVARYSAYLPLNKMWTSYIEELIQFPNSPKLDLKHAGLKMMKADLHGCYLTVKKSRCPSYVGLSGIVMQETRNMFVLVTSSDEVKRIPKAHSLFTFVLHDFVFTIHGNQFLVQPGDRAAKRYKPKGNIFDL